MALDPSLEPVIDAAAQQFDLDPNLIHAVIGQESSGRADATSPKGAEGLMQLMPATAKEMGVTDPYDPTQNIYGGARYLAQGLQKGEALKAGGANVDPVQYALQYYHGGDDTGAWGPITHAYVAQVANRYNAASAAAKPDQTAAAAAPSDAGPAPAGAALAPDLAPLAQLGRLGAPRGAEGGGGPMGGFADLATAGAAGGAPPVAANAPAAAALAPDLAPLARLGAPTAGFADLATAGAAPPGPSAAGAAGGAGAPALMAPLSSNAADLASATGAAGRPVAAAPGGAPAAAAADFAGARAAAGTTAAAAEPGAAAPETAPAPAANEFSGLSDAQIFQGLQDGSLRVTPPPAAAPATGSEPAPLFGPGAGSGPNRGAVAAPPATTGGAGAGGAGAAAPPPGAPAALDVKQMIDDYNFYRSFPSGLPQAQAVFTALSKMAPEGYQLNADGSMTARPGYAAAQAQVAGQKSEAEQGPIRRTQAVAPQRLRPGEASFYPPGSPQAPGTEPGGGATAAGGAAGPGSLVRTPQGGMLVTGNPPTTATDIQARYFHDLQQGAEDARTGLYTAEQLRARLNALPTNGPFTEFYGHLAAIAAQLGVPPDEVPKSLPAPGDVDAAKKLSIDLLGTILRHQFPGRVTNTDIATMAPSVAQVTTPLSANNFMIDRMMKPLLQRSIDRYQAVVDVPEKDPTYGTLPRRLNEFDAKPENQLQAYAKRAADAVAAAQAAQPAAPIVTPPGAAPPIVTAPAAPARRSIYVPGRGIVPMPAPGGP